MELVPRKLYKDVESNLIVGISYGSENTDLVNEVLFSTNKAKELNLQDSDIIDYLDLPVVDVYKGKLNMLFPLNGEVGFNKDDAEDGVILTVTQQIINGHVFNRYAGVEMDNEIALNRVLNAYDGDGKEDETY